MKTLRLLAGQSTRFWPLSEKTLFPVCGKNLLQIQIEKLREAGLSDIILVGGPHNLSDAAALFPELPTVEQENLDLGMQGALLSALPSCGTEPVLIVCGNDVIEPRAYTELVDTAASIDGALLAQEVTTYFPGGYLEVNNENRITSIVEKPGAGNEPSNLVNIVAHVHSDAASLLTSLQSASSDADDTYEVALAERFKTLEYKAVAYDDVWQAVKYPWHMLGLLDVLLADISDQYIHPNTEIHPSAVVDGNVIIEEGARILPNACVRGPCYIGKNVIIGNNALVRNASIGDNSVIGFGSEVARSVLHSNVWTHSTYIGDSVIGTDVSFGAGSVTGNLRLDEQEIASTVRSETIPTGLTKLGAIIGSHSRIAVHTSTNPGVKIGEGTFIATAAIVDQDIPEKSFVKMDSGKLSIRENKSSAPNCEKREK